MAQDTYIQVSLSHQRMTYLNITKSKTPLKMLSDIMFLEQSNESIMKTVDELIKAENG